MPTVSGPLTDVVGSPTTAREVWVRAAAVRPESGGLITTEPHRVQITGGILEFPCRPGPAVMVIVHAGGVPEKVPLVVPDQDTTLMAAVLAGRAADESTASALELAAAELAASLDLATNAASSAELARDAAIAAGLRWQGQWDRSATYVPGDAVGYNGSSWRAVVFSSDVIPVEGAAWSQIASGGMVLKQVDYLPDGTPYLLEDPEVIYPDPETAGFTLPPHLTQQSLDQRYLGGGPGGGGLALDVDGVPYFAPGGALQLDADGVPYF